MIKFYYKASSTSSRRVTAHLETNSMEYIGKNVGIDGLEKEEFMEILAGTEYGVVDILSTNSRMYKELSKEGVNFEEMTLGELLYAINKYPTLMKYPILVKNGVTLVGYNEDQLSLLRSRESRMKEHEEILKQARLNDVVVDMGITKRLLKETSSF